MPVLDRAALAKSPLADLHAIASELGLDGYRRLRKSDLIDALLVRQGGDTAPEPDADAGAAVPTAGTPGPDADADADASPRRRRSRRGGRGRPASDDATSQDEKVDEAPPAEPAALTPAASPPAATPAPARRPRTRRSAAAAAESAAEPESTPVAPGRDERPTPSVDAEPTGAGEAERNVEGTVELLANGSGFLRVSPPEPSDDDVYVSAAQVKRCELVSGDQVSGPRRPPRRSERFPSLIRVETINGQPATEAAQAARFVDLPASYPSDRIKLGSEDVTVKAIEWLTPFGKGSRVTIVGPARAGKTEALLRLADALKEQEDLTLQVMLIGVRPEEIGEWRSRSEPVAVHPLGTSSEAQATALEQTLDHARRLAARGGDVVVLIDGLADLPPAAARRALAGARNITGGGSLTVIASSLEPVGGETTVIALDVALAGAARYPALDLARSGTIRPDLLVGEAGAEAIARSRAEALEA